MWWNRRELDGLKAISGSEITQSLKAVREYEASAVMVGTQNRAAVRPRPSPERPGMGQFTELFFTTGLHFGAGTSNQARNARDSGWHPPFFS